MQCVCAHTPACVFVLFHCVCIKPLAHECPRMCIYSCVGVHLSVVAAVHLHWLNRIHLKVKYFLCADLFIYVVVRCYI